VEIINIDSIFNLGRGAYINEGHITVTKMYGTYRVRISDCFFYFDTPELLMKALNGLKSQELAIVLMALDGVRFQGDSFRIDSLKPKVRKEFRTFNDKFNYILDDHGIKVFSHGQRHTDYTQTRSVALCYRKAA
jgi:hypothetical protein